jgi:hypothetical protein
MIQTSQLLLLPVVSLLLSSFSTVATAFQIHRQPSRHASTTNLLGQLETGVIKGIEQEEEVIDFEKGGVRLALQQVVVLNGVINHKPGSADPEFIDLTRYTQLKELGLDQVQTLLATAGAAVICTGKGAEVYSDPGKTTEKFVQYAPDDAIKNAMAAAGPAMDYDTIRINVCGGDDLDVMQVVEACQTFVMGSDIKTGTKVYFHSMSYKDLAATEAWVTVIGIKRDESASASASASSGEVDEALTGAAKTVAKGQVYWTDGRYWSVAAEDINTDIE